MYPADQALAPSISRHRSAHRRHSFAQSPHMGWWGACASHASAQESQISAHRPQNCSAYGEFRLIRAADNRQMSAQSRQSRMHRAIRVSTSLFPCPSIPIMSSLQSIANLSTGKAGVDAVLVVMVGVRLTRFMVVRHRKAPSVKMVAQITRLIQREFPVCEDGGESKVLRRRSIPDRNHFRAAMPVKAWESSVASYRL